MEIARELESEVVQYEAQRSPMALKAVRYQSYQATMRRAPDGKARRRVEH